jgi:tetratricopeptide (TPR) repeat protein
LESLTVGKEEELRAQAETERQARVDEIMGRKRVEETAPVAEEAEAPVAEEEAEAPEEAEEIPDWLRDLEAEPAEEEALSGDDALAWLESLTVGKEEELRVQAEAEAQARVDEIMGRKQAEAAAPVAEEAEAPEAGEAVVEAEVEEREPEPVAVEVKPEAGPIAAEEGVPKTDEFFGWSSFGDPRIEFGGSVSMSAPSAALIGDTFFGWSSFDVERVEFGQEIRVELPAVGVSLAEPEAVPVSSAEETMVEPEVLVKTSEELDALREQVAQDPSNYEVRLTLARALWTAGAHKESLEHYNRLIRDDFELESVSGDLQQYTEEHPDNPSLLRALGDVYMKQGLLDQAMNLYKEAMALL